MDMGLLAVTAIGPTGIAALVGIVFAILRWRSAPVVARFAVVGFALLLAMAVLPLVALFLPVTSMLQSGWTEQSLGSLAFGLTLATWLVGLIAWALLLSALFWRLPRTAPASAPEDNAPTGRHALLDASGAQVVAEADSTLRESTLRISGFGTGVYAERTDTTPTPVPAPSGHDEPTQTLPRITGATPPPAPPATEPARTDVDEGFDERALAEDAFDAYGIRRGTPSPSSETPPTGDEPADDAAAGPDGSARTTGPDETADPRSFPQPSGSAAVTTAIPTGASRAEGRGPTPADGPASGPSPASAGPPAPTTTTPSTTGAPTAGQPAAVAPGAGPADTAAITSPDTASTDAGPESSTDAGPESPPATSSVHGDRATVPSGHGEAAVVGVEPDDGPDAAPASDTPASDTTTDADDAVGPARSATGGDGAEGDDQDDDRDDDQDGVADGPTPSVPPAPAASGDEHTRPVSDATPDAVSDEPAGESDTDADHAAGSPGGGAASAPAPTAAPADRSGLTPRPQADPARPVPPRPPGPARPARSGYLTRPTTSVGPSSEPVDVPAADHTADDHTPDDHTPDDQTQDEAGDTPAAPDGDETPAGPAQSDTAQSDIAQSGGPRSGNGTNGSGHLPSRPDTPRPPPTPPRGPAKPSTGPNPWFTPLDEDSDRSGSGR